MWRGRHYVVCGAGHGMGFATARSLVEAGAHVLVHARRAESVEAAVDRLRGWAAPEQRIAGVATDLSTPQGADLVGAAAREAFGALHGWVANTGGPPPGRAMEITDPQWQQAFDGTFLSVVRMLRAAAPLLQPGSAFVSIQSRSVREPIESLSTSNALRAAATAFLRDAAREMGGRGVRVLTVLPGIVRTERLTELSDHRAKEMGVDPEEIFRAWAEESPLKRIGAPEELARVILVALSDVAGYMTGTTILADGGAVRVG
ncbi:MAG: SDR family oxidoreductase [Candidatus Eisenbacteria bacterium]|nr:SDR family oxidoreductase [Candidatus Eisenbacteria bacterium]